MPPSTEKMIPEDHLVRVVNHVIDQIDLYVLEQAHPGGGPSCYHPHMMLKILVYGYHCPADQVLDLTRQTTKQSYRGNPQRIREYQSRDCQGCQLASQCKKGLNSRKIQISPEYEAYKQQFKRNLASEAGQKLRKQREVDVATPFGNIKRNMRYEDLD